MPEVNGVPCRTAGRDTGSEYRQLQLILIQGIALAGFNVVDIEALRRSTGLPVLAISRRAPRFARVRSALQALATGQSRGRV